jgi:MFS family permease
MTVTDHASQRLTVALLPFALIVFLGYAAVGIPLSTLPVQIHGTLGWGTTIVGILVGLAPAATLLTRQFAGALADRRGPKLAVLLGLSTTAATGLAYLASLGLGHVGGLGALAVGRILLGLGDSLFTTGVAAWAIARVGVQNAGKAMAWIGIAMYGALAVGAPVGAVLDAHGGFAAMSTATCLAPLLGMPIVLALPGIVGSARRRGAFLSVVRAIWAPGLGMVLASAGFGTIAAFLALRYAAEHWQGAGLALTSFGAAYILVRSLFAGLPDRLGGVRVAMICLAIEALGLLIIALATSPKLALLGTAVTGLGYSMVFPSLGVEAVRRVSVEHRGVALGAFLASFDLGLGAAGPVAGLVAGGFGLPAAFVAAAAAALASLVLVWITRRPNAAAPS